MHVKGFGWIRDHPDQRDQIYRAPSEVLRALPPWVDLRPALPPVYTQGSLGSCTANAIAAAIYYNQVKQRLAHVFNSSRLLIYYNGRALQGTIEADTGLMIREGIKSVAHWGVCPEVMWPYEIEAFRTHPPEDAYQVAAWHRAVRYERLTQDLGQMKGCLASGYPFAFGYTVYESFMSPHVARTGQGPMPGPRERVVASHAVLAVGYDDARQWFILRNSWGPGWGMQGYFTLPYAYLLQPNLSGDLWTIRHFRDLVLERGGPGARGA
jgi:C1A family cysteine protease